jgi:ADP-ribose pyrophosphatase
MTRYRDATYPPHGEWDSRLREVACTELRPAEPVHENAWFTVWRRGSYYTMEYRQPQVVVLPIVEGRAVVMVRVTRPVIGDTTLELPAGGAEQDEDPALGAARELAEEAGIAVSVDRLVPMPPIAVSPNRMPKLVYVFRVDLTQQEFDNRAAHDGEIESVELVPLDRAAGMIATGKIYVALPAAVIGAYLFSRRPTT